MRLAKIKLAGFKSFVDPTTLALPGNLVGIVGPNGCGKSNIIDAVRWVMGESSARHLRGESMADVVFNGSTSRKPVGQASIELVFDNSEGLLGGQYARFGEISVRRAVSRDGQSSYFLNGSRCRRRDITDVFLGTGLGPRSYAIIEQGMISRIIEAKPEELRGFIEEAAGISRYKERRRDTENRIRHTEENLARLGDVREELDKQLARLERQARTAERYQALKSEERQVRAELLGLRWRAQQAKAEAEGRRIGALETAHEGHVARLREIEARLERAREAQVEANDALNQTQARYYAVGSDVARIEQAIAHAEERRQQLGRDLERAERDAGDARARLAEEEAGVAGHEAELAALEPDLAAAAEAEAAARDALSVAEGELQGWQERWDAASRRAAERARGAEVERTRIQGLEGGLEELRVRLERLAVEHEGLDDRELAGRIRELEAAGAATQAERGEREAVAEDARAAVAARRDEIQGLGRELHERRGEAQDLRGRLASLQALQEEALGKRGTAVADWLAGRGLGDAPRVAEAMRVEPGWEGAVEAVCGHHLEAVAVDDLQPHAAAAADMGEGMLELCEAGGEAAAPDAPETLLARARVPAALAGVLRGVRTAANLDAALAARAGLGEGETLVTPDGTWIGPGWVRFSRGADATAGVLAREEELRGLEARTGELETVLEALQERLDQAREALAADEAALEEARGAVAELERRAASLEAERTRARDRSEQMAARRARIAEEREELEARRAAELEALGEARERLEALLADAEDDARERDALGAERERLREAADAARGHLRGHRDRRHELALRVEALRSRREALAGGLARSRERVAELDARREELAAALEEAADPLAESRADLERKLALQVEVEGELRQARDAVEGADATLRELGRERQQAEQDLEEGRGALEQARLEHESVLVRVQTLAEQLAEQGQEPEAVLAALPEEAEDAAWASRLEGLEQRIARLGAINLAAIEEFAQESERKAYLDAQHRDLTDALETLQSAIRKIDRETRTRFRETFERVDGGLKELFPALFGGGHAYLELTSEDLLEAGITVMARPPGKRNATIHLLSGGEKALTAVALVFAIFRLNPAPFCLLDEVDAPLDDANVGRFCDLVRSLSDRVQFMIITHNKTTMELADHLIGVTMHEPGVSRPVAVDVGAALEMATT